MQNMLNKKSNIDFKKYSPKSIENIEGRIQYEKTRQEIERTNEEFELAELNHQNNKNSNNNNNHIKKKSKTKNENKNAKTGDEKEALTMRPNKDFEAGKKLPSKFNKLFPKSLFGVPLEEIDPYYQRDYVFIVINSSYQIFRFNSKDALFCLSPFNKLRRFAVYLLTHSLFSTLVMITILVNCVIMALPTKSVPDYTE
jgi:hypothetical protein